MAYKITDKCVCCGSCQMECPVGAISQKDNKFVIDKEKCIECGTCAAVCTVSAPEQFIKLIGFICYKKMLILQINYIINTLLQESYKKIKIFKKKYGKKNIYVIKLFYTYGVIFDE